MIMKIDNILRLLAALALTVAMAACGDENKLDGGKDQPDDVVPEFPELVEDYAVLPGSVQEIVFTPNLAWKVSIASELRQWFWIKDGSFSVTELSGEASEEPVTVYLAVTENAEFDKNYSCDVTLAMGGESKVIAKYMLPAKEKVMEIYQAQKEADGSFKMSDDGESYVYETQPAASAELKWSAEAGKFILPLRIESNCEWTLTKPEWADVNVPEKTAGVVELVLNGFSLEKAEGKLSFYNGETCLKEISLSVPQGKDMAIYTAVRSDEGYEAGENGEPFKWNEAPAQKLELAWSGADFRLPVLFDAKCSWTAELPEWLQIVTYPEMENLPAETAGRVVALLKGVPSRYPLEDTEAKVVFKVGETVVHEVTASIPGCRSIMSFYLNMSLTSLEYNYLGAVSTSTGYVEESATGNVFGPKGVRIFAVETTGGKVGQVLTDDSWFKLEISAFVEGKDQSVLQDRTMTFSVEENTGDARSAVLFILPADVTTDVSGLFNDDASVKDEYVDYSVSIVQASMNYTDYITVSETDDSAFTFTAVEDDDQMSGLTAAFGETEHVYELVYNDVYAGEKARMTLAVPYTSYQIYDEDKVERTADASFWLAFAVSDENNRTSGVMEMYLGQTLPPVPSVGYVVFRGTDGNALAIVECVSPAGDYITMPSTESGLSYAFTEQTDSRKAELSGSFGKTDNIYRLTYTDIDKDSDGLIDANVEAVMGLSIPYASYKVFDTDRLTDRTADPEFWLAMESKDGGKESVIVTMYKDSQLPMEPSVGYVVFYGDDNQVYAVVECISPVGKEEAADPDTKLDVSAERFTDPAAASAAGATVYEVTAGPSFDKYKEYSAPILKLVYTRPNTSLSLNVPTNTFQFTTYDNTLAHDWVTIDGKDVYNDAGYLWEWVDGKGYVGSSPDGKSYDGTAEIAMNASSSASINVLLHPRDSAEGSVVCVIICILDLE